MAQNKILSFGPFDFEPSTGRLAKQGHKVKLQPKAAATLTCLLEQSGVVVSRARLRGKLWPEGTHVDFDLGIKVAVKKLRDALGDHAEEPVYIQTVYGEGYRFIASVECKITPDPRVTTPDTDQNDDKTGAKPEVLPGARSSARRFVWSAAIFATAVAAGSIWFASRSAALQFQSRDWVIIASFDNRTGERLLDGTMDYAIERALSQSHYVNVAPRERINDTLKLMRQSVNATLTDELARQVAIRDGGIRALLTGRIEKFGQAYVLTVRLLYPSSGSIAATFERQTDKDRLLDAARSVSDELRRELGEKRGSASAQPAALEKATTPSLTALRAFSLGMREVNKLNWGQAAVMLEEAVLEDPQFALAHIYAAHSYSNRKQNDQAAPHYEAAFRLASGVSQRERLFILGGYYSRFLHDDNRALDAYKALVNSYPDDYWGLRNLADTQARMNLRADRVSTLERLFALRPNDDNYPALLTLWDWYRFDHPDKTKALQTRDRLRRMRTVGLPPPDGWIIVDAPLDLETTTERWLNGDIKSASRELALVSARATAHRDDQYKMVVAMANLTLGKAIDATRVCEHVNNLAMHRECLLRVAYVTRNSNAALEQLSQLRDGEPSTPQSAGADVSIAAWLGDVRTAQRWSKWAVDRTASSTFAGWIHLAQGRWQAAVKDLQSLNLPFGAFTALWIRYPLALALEKQGRVDEAIIALEGPDVMRSSNLWTCWSWPLYYGKLAELYRKAGRIGDAVQFEDKLRHYLSAADPDYPVLEQPSRPAPALTQTLSR